MIRSRQVFAVVGRRDGLIHYGEGSDAWAMRDTGCVARVPGLKACGEKTTHVMVMTYEMTLNGVAFPRTRRIQCCAAHADHWKRLCR